MNDAARYIVFLCRGRTAVVGDDVVFATSESCRSCVEEIANRFDVPKRSVLNLLSRACEVGAVNIRCRETLERVLPIMKIPMEKYMLELACYHMRRSFGLDAEMPTRESSQPFEDPALAALQALSHDDLIEDTRRLQVENRRKSENISPAVIAI